MALVPLISEHGVLVHPLTLTSLGAGPSLQFWTGVDWVEKATRNAAMMYPFKRKWNIVAWILFYRWNFWKIFLTCDEFHVCSAIFPIVSFKASVVNKPRYRRVFWLISTDVQPDPLYLYTPFALSNRHATRAMRRCAINPTLLSEFIPSIVATKIISLIETGDLGFTHIGQ